MSLPQALAVCPNAVVVAGNYHRYAEYAERIRRILESFTPAVDPDAHQGFYLNFFGSSHLNENFSGTLRRLQLEILKHTGISVSIGAAKSKVVAAIASRLELPRGLRIIARGEEDAFLASLPVEAVDEINNIDGADLRKRGISTIAELRRVPLASLEYAYGDTLGRQIWENSRGRDARPSITPSEATSCSRETTINGGTRNPEYLAVLTNYLCERIANALREGHRQPRSISLRIRYLDQFSASQSLCLALATNYRRQLFAAANALVESLFTRPVPVHSLTVSVAASNANSSADRHLRETAISATA
jgi:DNA polymerase IV